MLRALLTLRVKTVMGATTRLRDVKWRVLVTSLQSAQTTAQCKRHAHLQNFSKISIVCIVIS